jgi:hypothetical protein
MASKNSLTAAIAEPFGALDLSLRFRQLRLKSSSRLASIRLTIENQLDTTAAIAVTARDPGSP